MTSQRQVQTWSHTHSHTPLALIRNTENLPRLSIVSHLLDQSRHLIFSSFLDHSGYTSNTKLYTQNLEVGLQTLERN